MAEYLPRDFVCRDRDAAEAKAAAFIRAGVDSLHVVTDFDLTLTTPDREGNNVTSWCIMRNHLPEEGQVACRRLYDYYHPLEVAGTLSEEQAIEWSSDMLELFVQYEVNMREVENDFVNKATIRDGTRELFTTCGELQIPTVIMSAGIKNVIDIWKKAYNVSPSIVLATALEVDLGGIVQGWDEGSLIHSLNKKEVGHRELNRIRAGRPRSIIIGDSLTDASMAEGDEDAFRVYVHNPRPGEDSAQMEEKALSRFDVIIKSGSILAVNQQVESIAAQSKAA